MACFIDDEAEDDLGRKKDSEDELSDVIPFQGQVKRLRSRLESSSGSDTDISSNDKENEPRQVKRKKRKRLESSREDPLFSELKKATELMSSLAKKMKKHESRLKAIENKLDSATSSVSSSGSTPKRSSVTKEVPCEVRVSD